MFFYALQNERRNYTAVAEEEKKMGLLAFIEMASEKKNDFDLHHLHLTE